VQQHGRRYLVEQAAVAQEQVLAVLQHPSQGLPHGQTQGGGHDHAGHQARQPRHGRRMKRIGRVDGRRA
jgi:hypothetical protein